MSTLKYTPQTNLENVYKKFCKILPTTKYLFSAITDKLWQLMFLSPDEDFYLFMYSFRDESINISYE